MYAQDTQNYFVQASALSQVWSENHTSVLRVSRTLIGGVQDLLKQYKNYVQDIPSVAK